MSGDCGHGWGYHENGPDSPCSKCESEKRLDKFLLASMEQEHILKLLKGIEVRVENPLGLTNPQNTFVVTDIKIEDGKLYLQGEKTTWFSVSILTRV